MLCLKDFSEYLFFNSIGVRGKVTLPPPPDLSHIIVSRILRIFVWFYCALTGHTPLEHIGPHCCRILYLNILYYNILLKIMTNSRVLENKLGF